MHIDFSITSLQLFRTVFQHFAHDNSRTVKVVVQGKNVGYGATCECMVQSAIVTLKQTEKLPSTGGVWTPGSLTDTFFVS